MHLAVANAALAQVKPKRVCVQITPGAGNENVIFLWHLKRKKKKEKKDSLQKKNMSFTF